MMTPQEHSMGFHVMVQLEGRQEKQSAKRFIKQSDLLLGLAADRRVPSLGEEKEPRKVL